MLHEVYQDYNADPHNLLYIAPSKTHGLGMFARSNIMPKILLGYVGCYLINRDDAKYKDPRFLLSSKIVIHK